MVLECVGVKGLFIRVYKTINESQERFPRRAMKHRIACPGPAPKTLRGEICEKAHHRVTTVMGQGRWDIHYKKMMPFLYNVNYEVTIHIVNICKYDILFNNM